MRKVILTAGHNGPGTGANGNGVDEASEAINLRNEITQLLNRKGVTVENDRDTDRLSAVIAWVKKVFRSSDLLIEIHFNASGNREPSGTECFIRPGAGKLAAQVASQLCEVTARTLEIKTRGGEAADAKPAFEACNRAGYANGKYTLGGLFSFQYPRC